MVTKFHFKIANFWKADFGTIYFAKCGNHRKNATKIPKSWWLICFDRRAMSVSEKDVKPALISKIELICFRHIRLINISSKYSYVQRGVLSWNDLICSSCRQRISEMVPACTYVYATKSSCTGVYHPRDNMCTKQIVQGQTSSFFYRSTKFKEFKHLLSRML